MEAQSQLSIGESHTSATHRQAVERVILQMRDHLADPLSLSEMARIAYLSPFHFDRVFHQTTGIPPVQFLYALRIEAAKRLLLTTSLSVTDVCYEVGYNSLGTFTSRFTQLVGLSPRGFRRLAAKVEDCRLDVLIDQAAALLRNATFHPSITGRITGSVQSESSVFVGLFPTLIPQGRPVAGTLLSGSNFYRLPAVADGRYNVFAAAFPKTGQPQSYLMPDPASLMVGVGSCAAEVLGGQFEESIDIRLRALQVTDPPILIALPFLLVEVLGQTESRVPHNLNHLES